MAYGFVILLVVTVAVLVARLRVWRVDAGSRALTVLVALLVAAIVTHHPAVLGARGFGSGDSGGIHVANWTNVIGDLVVLALTAYLTVLVARAWMAQRLVPFILAGFAALAVVLVLVWQFSDASRVPIDHISELGGLANLYSLVSASALVFSGLAVCASAALTRTIRPHLRVALWALALACGLGAVVGVLHFVGALQHPGQAYLDPPWATPLSKVAILLVALSGVLDLYHRRTRGASAATV